MGIKGLTKLLAEHAPGAAALRRVEDYRGRVIAIDASLSIYQFLVVVGRKGTEVLTNEAGEVTRTVRLLEGGIKPVFVFDGEPPELKKKELAKRNLRRDDASKDLHRAIEVGDEDSIEKFSKRTVKITKKHNDDCKRLLRLMGVPVVECLGHSVEYRAPFELKEAKCMHQSFTLKNSTSLTYTVPLWEALTLVKPATGSSLPKSGGQVSSACELLQNLKPYKLHQVRQKHSVQVFVKTIRCKYEWLCLCCSFRGYGHLTDLSFKKSPVTEFEVPMILEELGLTMDQFIDLCILSGCDYCENIKGIGGQRALKLIRQHGCIEEIVQNLKQTRFTVPEDWPYQEVRTLFKEPNVCTEIPDFMWTSADKEGLVNFLATENSFSSDRIEKAVEKLQAARDRYSPVRAKLLTPVANVPGSITKKEPKCMLGASGQGLKGGSALQVCSSSSSDFRYGSSSSKPLVLGTRSGFLGTPRVISFI